MKTKYLSSIKPIAEKSAIGITADITKLGTQQLVELFLSETSNDYAFDEKAKQFYTYNENHWQITERYYLEKESAAFFNKYGINYSAKKLNDLLALLSLSIDVLEPPEDGLIGFSDIIINRLTGEIIEHHRKHWLTSIIPFPYQGRITTTPNFDKWLNFSSEGDFDKKNTLLAVMYMVLTNQHSWQLFVEITGCGGTGKSILMNICTKLVGKENFVSINLDSLDNPKERYPIKDKLLIICPDQLGYKTKGTGLKAITGGDTIRLDPKYKNSFDYLSKAIVIIVNNEPIQFLDYSGGIERRRIIIQLAKVVPVNDKDSQLLDKIETEIPNIISNLLHNFKDPKLAKNILLAHKASHEALEVKLSSDPIAEFCSHFITTQNANGLFIGNSISKSPDEKLYTAYLLFLKANNIRREITLPNFSESIAHALKQNGCEYIFDKKRNSKGFQTNVHFKNKEDFINLFIKQ